MQIKIDKAKTKSGQKTIFCCLQCGLQWKFEMRRCVYFWGHQSSYFTMFPVSSHGNEDDLESAELQLAASTPRHLTGCHHCGALSVEETKGSVSMHSSSPRQTDTVAASWKQAAQTGLMPERSHAPPLPHPINQAFICFLHRLPVILSADFTVSLASSDKLEENVNSWISNTRRRLKQFLNKCFFFRKVASLFTTVVLGKSSSGYF